MWALTLIFRVGVFATPVSGAGNRLQGRDSSHANMLRGVGAMGHFNRRRVPTVGGDRVKCDIFAVSNTNFGQRNYATCTFRACVGQSLLVSSCDNCLGEQLAQLWAYNLSATAPLVVDSDGCGNTCSQFTYEVPALDNSSEAQTACYEFELREACNNEFDTCRGGFVISASDAKREDDSKANYNQWLSPNTVTIALVIALAFVLAAWGSTLLGRYIVRRNKYKHAPIFTHLRVDDYPAKTSGKITSKLQHVTRSTRSSLGRKVFLSPPPSSKKRAVSVGLRSGPGGECFASESGPSREYSVNRSLPSFTSVDNEPQTPKLTSEVVETADALPAVQAKDALPLHD